MEKRMKGISIDELTEEEIATMKRFDDSIQYPPISILAGIRHQIVHHKGKYIGIAIAKNGRKDFIEYRQVAIYRRLSDNFIGMSTESTR